MPDISPFLLDFFDKFFRRIHHHCHFCILFFPKAMHIYHLSHGVNPTTSQILPPYPLRSSLRVHNHRKPFPSANDILLTASDAAAPLSCRKFRQKSRFLNHPSQRLLLLSNRSCSSHEDTLNPWHSYKKHSVFFCNLQTNAVPVHLSGEHRNPSLPSENRRANLSRKYQDIFLPVLQIFYPYIDEAMLSG